MKNNPFKNAMQQLEYAAHIIELGIKNKESRKRFLEKIKKLKEPQRILKADIEVPMDNGLKKIFRAYRIQYNNAMGPYKGGIRFHPHVSLSEVKALAFWMTLKCAVSGLPMGGGKGGVVVDPKKLSESELERLSRSYVRAFARYIGPYTDIPAPDVNTNGVIMGWMADEYIKIKCAEVASSIFRVLRSPSPSSGAPSAQGSKLTKLSAQRLDYLRATFTGKLIKDGGSEGREEATGLGGLYVLKAILGKYKSKSLRSLEFSPPTRNSPIVRSWDVEPLSASADFSSDEAQKKIPRPSGRGSFNIPKLKFPQKLTVAVMGFGNVGYNVSKFLSHCGFNVVAVSDSKGGIYVPEGINPGLTLTCKKKNGFLAGCYCSGSVCDLSKGRQITNEELLELPVDILVPAALEGVINKDNAGRIKAKIILEMANGPTTQEADRILRKRGIIVVPDILANSGGVTVSTFEWEQNIKGEKWSKEKVMGMLETKMESVTHAVWETSVKYKTDLRTAAFITAIKRILSAFRNDKHG